MPLSIATSLCFVPQQQHQLTRTGESASAEAAAENLGVECGAIVKSLAFVINGERKGWHNMHACSDTTVGTGTPYIVLIGGDRVSDKTKLAQLLGVTKRKIKMASHQECLSIFGYAPGTFPPFAHRQRINTIMDQ